MTRLSNRPFMARHSDSIGTGRRLVGLHPAYLLCALLSAPALIYGYFAQKSYDVKWHAVADKYDTTPEVVTVAGLQVPQLGSTRSAPYYLKGVRMGGGYSSHYWTTVQAENWYFVNHQFGLPCAGVLADYEAAVDARYGAAQPESLLQTSTAAQGQPVRLLVIVPRLKEKPAIPAWCPELSYDAKSGELRYAQKRVGYLLSAQPQ